MKRHLLLLALAMVMGLSSLAGAAPPKVAVFPFDVFSRERLGHLKKGLQELMGQRLSAEGVVAIDPKKINAAVAALKAPLDLSKARRIAGKLGAQYAVFGSLTKIGNRVSLDVKLLDVLGLGRPQSLFVEGVGLESLSQLAERLARQVASRMAGRVQVAQVLIKGNRRIGADAIMNVITSKVGRAYSPARLDSDLRKIWAMGYFDNVRIQAKDSPKGKIITFVVREKPLVREVRVTGADAIDSKDILDQIEVKKRRVFKPEAVKASERKILEMYRNKGYFDARVRSQVVTLPSGELSVRFNIKEGKKVYVATVRFSGNKAFSDSKLKDLMSTSERGWFSWITESGLLDRSKLEQDRQKISEFYYNNGYMTARVGAPQIERGEAGLVISINIVEGPVFKIGKIEIQGDLLKPKKQMLAGLQTKPGQVFNRERLRADLIKLVDLYSERGYAYVDVRPQVVPNKKKGTAEITLIVKQGAKIFIERIVITGNTVTRDKVIRRELGLAEGDLFSGRALRDGNRRLHRLQFFEDIHISRAKGSGDDRMILRVRVKEKRTGQFSIGAGFSTVDNFLFMVRVAEHNLFGRGQRLSLQAALGGTSSRYTLSFTEPWLFDWPVSAGFDLFNWEREFLTYTKVSKGGRIRFGFPTPWEHTRFFTYYTYEETEISDVTLNTARIIRDQVGTHSTSSLRFILRRDTRDHPFLTTRGSDHSISFEYAGGVLGGDSGFVKVIGETGWYFPLLFKTVFVAHGRVGWAAEQGGTFFAYQKFFLGGINSLRGFEYQRVGPLDPETGDVIGGERMVQANFELRFPLLSKAGVVGVIFYDTGNVWTKDVGYDLGDLRKSVGGGVRWYSPLGPLRIEWGYVLDRRRNEDASNWEFTIGGLF